MTNNLPNHIKFEENNDMELLLMCKPFLIAVMFGVVDIVVRRNIPGYKITITRSLSHNLPESVSDTHPEGRAIDIRTKDMPSGMADTIVNELNFLIAEKYGAFSLNDGKPRFAVLETDHIHLQIRKDIPENEIVKLFSLAFLYIANNKGIFND